MNISVPSSLVSVVKKKERKKTGRVVLDSERDILEEES